MLSANVVELSAQDQIVREFSASLNLPKNAPARLKSMETVLGLVEAAARENFGYALSVTKIIAKGFPNTPLAITAREKLNRLQAAKFG